MLEGGGYNPAGNLSFRRRISVPLASARPLACSRTWKRGSAEDYARIFGGSGGAGITASTNCAVVAYPSSMQRSPPVHRPGSGACPDTRRFNTPYEIRCSTLLVSPESSCLCRLNSIEPPWYGPVCPVVWEGWRRETPPYPDLWRKADISSRRPPNPVLQASSQAA